MTTDLPENNKLMQFDEFFSIKHKFNVNIERLAPDHNIDYQGFVDSIPLPFKIAGDMLSIDQAALRPLQGLSNSAGQLVEYLQHQASKIDMLVGYILSQQDQPENRFVGVQFGGGGVIFNSQQTFSLGEQLILKIFLLEDNCAVYCLGEIVEITEQSNDGCNYKVIFEQIREADREQLVRTSLHQQSKQLQALSKQRNQAAQKD